MDITGTNLADFLFGDVDDFNMSDRIWALDGNDEVYAGWGADWVYGGDGNDLLFGEAGNDRLYGEAGGDRLDGGAGSDTMAGGAGNDTYVVDRSGDVITEIADEGVDVVESSVSYTLSAHVEVLRLTGSAAINGTGDGMDNQIFGNTASNTLSGGGGNDYLDGGGGADTMQGGTGGDQYVVDNVGDQVIEHDGDGGGDTVWSFISWTLGANVEWLRLTGDAAIDGTGNNEDNYLWGNGAVNTLVGGRGHDALDGGVGSDTLHGGAGNDRLRGSAPNWWSTEHDTLIGGSDDDTYFSVDANDILIEQPNEGIDSIYSFVDYELGENFENLSLIHGGPLYGGSATTATGNNAGNGLEGNSLNNFLHGLGGADHLIGHEGNDELRGGSENDRLEGGSNDDRLFGGTGVDEVLGGAGADDFVLESSLDAPAVGASAEYYSDFSEAQGDQIDLSAIDANASAPGNQAFTPIGTGAFTNVAGQLRYDTIARLLEGDVDGNGAADFQIRLDSQIMNAASVLF